MPAVELHYARAKLWRMVALGVALGGLFLWVGLDSSMLSGEGSGRGARLARAVGPELLQIVILASAAAMAVMLFFYLRLLLSGDSLAARADRDGVTVRSLFGTAAYAWSEVETVYLQRVPSPAGEQVLVALRPRRGRQTGLALNGLAEEEGEAEAWVDAAEQMRLGA